MKNLKKTLPQIENDYVSLRNGLILKIKDIVSSQPDQTIHISGDEVCEPTWVLYETEGDSIESCSIESVFIDADGKLAFTLTTSYGETTVNIDEAPYFCDSLKWLVDICHNICDALGIEPESFLI